MDSWHKWAWLLPSCMLHACTIQNDIELFLGQNWSTCSQRNPHARDLYQAMREHWHLLLQYIYQPLHTATLCIRLVASDISLHSPDKDATRQEIESCPVVVGFLLARRDKIECLQYILRMAGIWRNAPRDIFWTKQCVVARVSPATGSIQMELRLAEEEKQSSMDDTDIPPHQNFCSDCN